MPPTEMRYSDALPERSVGAQLPTNATDLFLSSAQRVGTGVSD